MIDSKEEKRTYIVFSLSHPKNDAIKRFQDRIGSEPEEITQDHNGIWMLIPKGKEP